MAAVRISSRSDLEVALTDQILDGDYAPGTKLPSERELVEESGLSRPVIREVLRGLQERGLIDIQSGRGAFVRPPSSMNISKSLDALARASGATARDLVEARAMLESRTASIAAERATADEIAALRALSSAFDRATGLVERARCDLAFHAMIAKSTHNPVLEMMFGAIAPLIFELQVRSLTDPETVRVGAPLHHDVLDGIAAHHVDDASRAMWDHVTLANDTFGADFDQPLDAVARREIAQLLGTQTTLEQMIAEVLGA